MRRSLVIGLGNTIAPLLDGVHTYFEKADVPAGQLATLLLTPDVVDDEAQHLDRLSLALDHDQLSELYFRDKLRFWSGPNWQYWQDYLLSNRLYGKLALYQYRPRVIERVLALINAINKDDSLPLNLMVLAPVHDPFASGALLDLAYLISAIGQQRTARVYGLLILPNSSGDPVAEQYATADPTHTTSLLYATAYAALRELNFVMGTPSFYQSHHDYPLYQVDVEDESPFQSGDCYVIGGHLDGHKRNITWEKLTNQLAQWIYLQTVTPMTDHLATSVPNQHLFSAFGVTEKVVDAVTESRQQIDQIVQLLLRYVLDSGTLPSQQTLNIDHWFSSRAAPLNYDEFYGVLGDLQHLRRRSLLTLGRSNLAIRLLERLDEQFMLAVDVLRQIEREMTRHSRQQLKRMIDTVKKDLYDWRQQSGIALSSLETTHGQIIHQALLIYRQQRDHIDGIERETSRLATDLSEARAQLMYFGSGYPLLRIMALPFIGLWLSVAVLLFNAGLPISMILWLILGLIVPSALVVQIQNQREQGSQRNYVETQRRFLENQRALAEDGALNAFQYYLRTELRQRLLITVPTDEGQSADMLRAAYIRIACENLLAEYQSNDAQVFSPRYEIERLMAQQRNIVVPRLIDALWNRLDKDQRLDTAGIREEIENVINAYLTIRLETDETQVLTEFTAGQTEAVGALLATKDTLIDERFRQDARKVVGVSGWTEQAINEAIDVFQGRSVQIVDLDDRDAAAPPSGESVVRRLLTVSVQNNIPMRAILDLEQWRMAYSAACLDPHKDLRFRCFFQPTRVGIASPEIGVTKVFETQTLVIDGFVFLLHVLDHRQLIQRLCYALKVQLEPATSFDELCGALHERPEILFEEDILTSLPQEYTQIKLDLIFDLWTAIEHYERPRISERYADWEIWIFDMIKAALARQERVVTLRLLQHIIAETGLDKTDRANLLLKRLVGDDNEYVVDDVNDHDDTDDDAGMEIDYGDDAEDDMVDGIYNDDYVDAVNHAGGNSDDD